MKRVVLLFVVAGFVALLPLGAQDFTQPKAQFMSFNFGVPFGYDTQSDALIAGGSVGIDFSVIDNLSVGINMVKLGSLSTPFSFLQFAYNFTPAIGAALSLGAGSGGAAVGIGIYADLFSRRSSHGIANALRLRFDYLANTNAFDQGKVLFTTGLSFGL